jgi:MerR family transcriptional regulator, heat shock protein HspR
VARKLFKKKLTLLEVSSAMPQAEQQRCYSISEAADILCISIPTLRMYEREGLILPHRKLSGHRAYTEAEMDRIRCFRQTMAREKVTIAQFKHLLSTLPCWEINQCSEPVRSTCVAYNAHEGPCWAVTGKSWQEKCSDCLTCEVYKRAAGAEELVRSGVPEKV